MTQRIVHFTFSDTHCGSHEGLTAPGTVYTGNDGKNQHTITRDMLSDDQLWLWDLWLEAIEKLGEFAGSDPIIVDESGDPVHGTNHLDNTYSVVDIEQANIAVQARYPIHAALKSIIAWRLAYGTAAHDYGQSSGTRQIAASIAAWGVNPEHGAVLERNDGGFITNLAHHGPTVGRLPTNRGGALRTYVNALQLERISDNLPVPNMIIRGHVHRHYFEPVQLQWGSGQLTTWGLINAPMCGPNLYAFQAARTPDRWQAGPCMWSVEDGKMGEFISMVRTRSTIYKGRSVMAYNKANFCQGDGQME